MKEIKDHAKYAASSSSRWMNCPASIKLSEKAPKAGSSAAADEGTQAHTLMEWALIGNSKDVVNDFDEKKFPLEMRQHVQGFVDFVRAEMQDHFDLLVEEKVYLDFIHPTEAFGTVDVAIVEPFGTLHVIDFKYGQGFVDHRNNSQMLFYALGIAHKFKYDFDQVKTTIYQPRTGSTDVARTDSFSVDKLKAWANGFRSAVEACEDADIDKDLSAGEWCKFCPAKVICPEITRKTFEVAKLDFSDNVQPSPSDLSISQLQTILDRSAYLELWIKEVRKYAEDRIRSGKKIKGWGLVPTKPQRVWKDQAALKKRKLLADLLIKKDELVTPAQAEKLLKKIYTKKELEKFLNDNVVAVSSGDKLSQLTNDYDDEGLDDLLID
jgi:hypothetical protein